jgi:pimeloyl-ACP methyl ester carboxylesterase
MFEDGRLIRISVQFARNGDVELAFDVEGSGPDLLLIAGTASARALWSLVRPQLARSFRTIAFDNRDSGASTIVRESYTLRDLASDAAAVLAAAGTGRAHVLGHSMGGAIAQELALSEPSLVASLTLACTWARGDGYSHNLMSLMRALTIGIRDDRTLLAAILFMGGGATALDAASLWDMTDAAMALGTLAPREALQRQWELDLTVDTLDRLPALALPVHVIWGSEDRLIPPQLARALAGAIAGAVETRIECGHLPMIEAPKAFSKSVTHFVEVL